MRTADPFTLVQGHFGEASNMRGSEQNGLHHSLPKQRSGVCVCMCHASVDNTTVSALCGEFWSIRFLRLHPVAPHFLDLGSMLSLFHIADDQ